MLSRWSFLLSLIVVGAISTTALALPKVDPALRKYFGPTDTVENVTVIVMFHDKTLLPHLEHSVMSHAQMEEALKENAKASQMATMQRLFHARESGLDINGASLWLVNGAVLHIPSTQLKDLARDEAISSILADRKAHLVGTTQDSDESPQGKFTYGLEKINLPALRQKAPNITGQGVRVGVIDTGIDATHPDLKDRLLLFKDFVNNKTEPYDDNSHGTHVSGTIAGGNASGTSVGVAPGAKIIMGKVFSSTGAASDSDLLKAMQWMADPDGNPEHQPQIVSNSWGSDAPDGSKDPMDEPLCKAIAGWAKVGILAVFAAGNEGPDSGTVGIPGACPQALTVGATDKNDDLAYFSSRGPSTWKSGAIIKPTVSAPGVDVISTIPGGGYKAYSGTSMATPHVAGLAALVVQAVPNVTIENVQKLIIAGATHLGSDEANEPNNQFGAGRIDAYNTLKNAYFFVHGGQPAPAPMFGSPSF
jgi:bacillopeptidase F